jgi:hypothetical protein
MGTVEARGTPVLAGAPPYTVRHYTRRQHKAFLSVLSARVTFYEEMVTVAYLKSRPDGCSPIKKAAVVALAGLYLTLSCIRYQPTTSEFTVSLEGFEQRTAAPPVR